MSAQQHTQGKLVARNWSCHAPITLAIERGDCTQVIAECTPSDTFGGVSNAHRLVACWNACEGIADPENVVPQLLRAHARIPAWEAAEVQRSELLAALQAFAGAENFNGWHDKYREAIAKARAAIAKATGGQS